MASIPLTKVKVADQASTVLADLPYIARRIDRQKIIASVTATWPDPPAPLIYWPHSHWPYSGPGCPSSTRPRAPLMSPADRPARHPGDASTRQPAGRRPGWAAARISCAAALRAE